MLLQSRRKQLCPPIEPTMATASPLYRREQCSFAGPLQWGLTVFWRAPVADDSWFQQLADATESDGIRLLGHRFAEPAVSQFTVSTKSHVSPRLIVQRIKGRLQYLLRDNIPRPWRRNFAIRSVGKVAREDVEDYVASQLGHHQMADELVQARLARLQIVNAAVDLFRPQRTSHGLFWYNLHLVLVHRERLREIRDEVLSRVREMIVRASQAKGYRLSRGGILTDHVHLVLGCPFEISPEEVAIGFLNNLSYVHGMKPVFQHGGFLGTCGEYTNRALQSATRPV